jgi:hypothetical protein
MNKMTVSQYLSFYDNDMKRVHVGLYSEKAYNVVAMIDAIASATNSSAIRDSIGWGIMSKRMSISELYYDIAFLNITYVVEWLESVAAVIVPADGEVTLLMKHHTLSYVETDAVALLRKALLELRDVLHFKGVRPDDELIGEIKRRGEYGKWSSFFCKFSLSDINEMIKHFSGKTASSDIVGKPNDPILEGKLSIVGAEFVDVCNHLSVIAKPKDNLGYDDMQNAMRKHNKSLSDRIDNIVSSDSFVCSEDSMKNVLFSVFGSIPLVSM